jgi:hypothetical protein
MFLSGLFSDSNHPHIWELHLAHSLAIHYDQWTPKASMTRHGHDTCIDELKLTA